MRAPSFLHSLRHAANGVRLALNTQRNMRMHAAVAALVVVAGIALPTTSTEWIILALTIGFVFQAELMNTALEAVVDKASPEIHPLAKAAKDCAAAAVLVAAFTAVVVGALIFVPKLLTLL
jgi:diacylglycerol kinase